MTKTIVAGEKISDMEATQGRLLLQINNLDALAKTFICQREKIMSQMAELEQQGAIQAALFYHWQKYLYLIYPMKAGKRKRVYIGSDQSKIAAAEAKVERGKQHLALAQQLNLIDDQLTGLVARLDTLNF